jgi:hypothetical protein
MSTAEVRIEPSLLNEHVGRLERCGAGRADEIARRLGTDWTGNEVTAALAAQFSDGVAGQSHLVGFWCAA